MYAKPSGFLPRGLLDKDSMNKQPQLLVLPSVRCAVLTIVLLPQSQMQCHIVYIPVLVRTDWLGFTTINRPNFLPIKFMRFIWFIINYTGL
jgi:hypothetical protein